MNLSPKIGSNGSCHNHFLLMIKWKRDCKERYFWNTWREGEERWERRERVWFWKSDFINWSASSSTTVRTHFIRKPANDYSDNYSFIQSLIHSFTHSLIPPSSSCAIRSASRPGVAINTFTFCLKRYFYPSYQLPISSKSFTTIMPFYLLFTTFPTNQQGCPNTFHICGKLFGYFFDLNS